MTEENPVLLVTSSVLETERNALDDLAEKYCTSRRGIIRVAIRHMLANPDEVQAWFDRIEGLVIDEGVWLDGDGNEVAVPEVPC